MLYGYGRGAMALKDRTPKPDTRGPGCTTGMFIAGLSSDDRSTLEGWLADGRNTAKAICRELAEEYPDFNIRPETLQRHRTRGCTC